MLKVFKEKANSGYWDAHWSKLSTNELYKIDKGSFLEKKFLKFLPKDGKILEGGCGLGQWVKILVEHGYDIFGLDFAEETVKTLNKTNPELKISKGDVFNLLLKDGGLSGYISLGVIEHFEEGPEKIIKEMKRVLRRDGILIVTVPFQSMFLRFKYFFNNNQKGEGAFYQYHYNLNEMKSFFEEFSVIDVDYFDPFKTLRDESSLLKKFHRKIKGSNQKERNGNSINVNNSEQKSLIKNLNKIKLFRWFFGHMIILTLKNDKKDII
ncbi:hypothetical protein C0584_01730 [Candidatus Parcubacteria bacterium]|nr:MAG: hypothetical protein C0584_01730 [Candidatus Parcubacteria bacterium]